MIQDLGSKISIELYKDTFNNSYSLEIKLDGVPMDLLGCGGGFCDP